MAQIETLVFQALTGLVSGRVYPDIAPTNTPRPYITYQQVGGDPVAYVGKELSDNQHALVQFNTWADTRLEASALCRQIEAALVQATAFEARPESGLIAQHEPDLTPPGYGARQDFSIWHPRS